MEQCRVIGSAKLPLRLMWHNPEPLADMAEPTHEILFKNGDGTFSIQDHLIVFRSMSSIVLMEWMDL